MGDRVRVLVLGTGEMGRGIARLVLEKPGLELVGACARRPSRAGLDLGPVIGLQRELGIAIGNDLEALVAATRPTVAIQATCSRLADALPELETLLRHRVNVVSIAEEMAWPDASSPQTAARLRRAALEQGVGLLGTGINPGFVLDLLVIALSGVCAEIDSITARRVNDLAPYGPTVLRAQGVGLDPKAFERGLADGSVVGHIGFRESIRMIAASLGWDIERVEETRRPIVSSVARATPHIQVRPGEAAGCEHRALAYRQGRPVISLVHPQQVHPHLEGIETGDEIRIEGRPAIRLAGSPEIPGGEGTVALAVNTIPRLLAAGPGLHSMADLPLAAALPGRRFPAAAEGGGA